MCERMLFTWNRISSGRALHTTNELLLSLVLLFEPELFLLCNLVLELVSCHTASPATSVLVRGLLFGHDPGRLSLLSSGALRLGRLLSHSSIKSCLGCYILLFSLNGGSAEKV